MNRRLIIFDKPYISKEMVQYVTDHKIPVLDNEMAQAELAECRQSLITTEQAVESYDSDTRIYTASENALAWIYQHIKDPQLIHSIAQCKDKIRFREMLAPIYPDYYFCSLSIDQLQTFDSQGLQLPVILKPAVGFFSVGVHTIYTHQDWERAVQEITDNHQRWKKDYPESVIGDEIFIIEQYIEGDEYAIDAYFDQNGKAVIVNIMKHDFSDAADVSDRLYYTSSKIIREYLEPFTDFLHSLNHHLKAANFPVHIEVRVKDGQIVPIECNPMRFAGWCTTDLTWFAFGFRTYDYYLHNLRPDWDALLAGKEDKRYGMVILDKPAGFDEKAEFDYGQLCSGFKKVLSIRKLDYKVFPVFGFLFTETEDQDPSELEKIMKSDLTEYIK